MTGFDGAILTPWGSSPTSTPVFGFYRAILNRLWLRKTPAMVVGGMACDYYHLHHFERDWDVLVPPESAQRVLELLSKMTFEGNTGKFALHAGAPLAEKWLRGGWSSHVFFGARTRPQAPFARIDFFGCLLRGQQADFDQNPRYLSRNSLAWMKRTRRDKDWSFVHLLGMQMLRRGELEGVLHLKDPEMLHKIAGCCAIPTALEQLRPILKLAAHGDSIRSLEGYILADRCFWQELDKLRMEAFQKAWEPYGAEIKQRTDLPQLPLGEQNEVLIQIAAKTLNPDPLPLAAWADLIQKCRDQTQSMFGNLNVEYLPSPDAETFLRSVTSPAVSRVNKAAVRKAMLSNLVYQECVSDELGSERAALGRLPHAVLLDQIHDGHHNFVMPQETVWPAECYLGSELP